MQWDCWWYKHFLNGIVSGSSARFWYDVALNLNLPVSVLQTLQKCLLFCLSFYFLGTELPLFFGSKSPPLHSWRGLLRTKIFLTALNFCFYIRLSYFGTILNYFQCLQVLYCWSGTYYWRHFLTFSSRELNTLIQIVVVLRCCYLYTCICKTRQRLNIV